MRWANKLIQQPIRIITRFLGCDVTRLHYCPVLPEVSSREEEATEIQTKFDNIFLFHNFFFNPSLHAKAGETVLVHGASGGVGKNYFLFHFAFSNISLYQGSV